MSHDLGYVTKAGTGIFGAPGHSLCFSLFNSYDLCKSTRICMEMQVFFRPQSDIILIVARSLLDQQLDLYVINYY